MIGVEYRVTNHIKEVLESNMSIKAKMTYVAIDHLAKETKNTKPSLKQLGCIASIKSKTTLISAIKELVENQFVTVQHRGVKTSNSYKLLISNYGYDIENESCSIGEWDF
jgi:hypothetical protein